MVNKYIQKRLADIEKLETEIRTTYELNPANDRIMPCQLIIIFKVATVLAIKTKKTLRRFNIEGS